MISFVIGLLLGIFIVSALVVQKGYTHDYINGKWIERPITDKDGNTITPGKYIYFSYFDEKDGKTKTGVYKDTK